MSIPLSIVIPVKNEAGNLPACLESVSDFSEVVVVDSGSTDTTREIARQFQRTVVDFVWDGKFPKKRNWTLLNHRFQNPWVLFLDADERMTSEVKSELARTLPITQHHAFWIGYRNWFMGRLLKHGDPMRKMALLRIGHGEYERILEDGWSSLDMEIHEHLVVDGSVGVLTGKLEHHDTRSLHAYYARHNEYSTWEANRYLALPDRAHLTGRQRVKYRMLTWPIFPVMYFLASYILKFGFLDGRAGFYFALGKMFYFYQIQAKIHEMRGGQGVLTQRRGDAGGSETTEDTEGTEKGENVGGARTLELSGGLEGQAAEKRAKKMKYARMPLFWRAFAYFCYRYFLRGGFLEGKEGFLWHFLQGWWYRTLVDAKIFEIKRESGGDRDKMLALLREKYGMKI